LISIYLLSAYPFMPTVGDYRWIMLPNDLRFWFQLVLINYSMYHPLCLKCLPGLSTHCRRSAMNFISKLFQMG